MCIRDRTAFFASDPNLGRILAAVGYAGIDDLDVSNIRLWLDDVLVAKDGGRNPAYQEADGQRVMKQAEITVRIALGRGQVKMCIRDRGKPSATRSRPSCLARYNACLLYTSRCV